ncbi:Zinc finger protein SHOOT GRAVITROPISM 5 [Linum grandiflorum]
MFPIKYPSSSSLENNNDESSAAVKRKRRPAGTPDPDAEVVSLSPQTLMESDRYVCEICNQGFQRDQNLQMHRRRHKVPWKLLKRDTTAEAAAAAARKRVFVCPEPSCLHHDPCHALGDLVGIKKHFRRKHSNQKQWVCDKCGKGYAVQSDYKAHLKTCGTRGHSCDCGRVFSRVESFIEHQDSCTMSRLRPVPEPHPFACFSRSAASSPSPSDVETPPPPPPPPPPPRPIIPPAQPPPPLYSNYHQHYHHRNRMITTPFMPLFNPITPHNNKETQNIELNLDLDLQLSVGRSNHDDGGDQLMRVAVSEKAYAKEARKEAKRQIQLAEEEFANAKMIRQHAQTELDRAQGLKQQAMKQMSSSDVVLLSLMTTCTSCRQKLTAADENSLVVSYLSSGVTDHGGEVEKRR